MIFGSLNDKNYFVVFEDPTKHLEHSPMNSCHGCEKEKKAVGKIFIK